jgi:hypothetical protein
MPFRKIGPKRYVSPSGRVFTERQVRLYYANDGFPSHKQKHRIPRAKKDAKGSSEKRRRLTR